jgi:hypothetical protein
MSTPTPPKRAFRCHAGDEAGIAERVAEATWDCPTCGRIEADTQYAGAYVFIHRRVCACELAARSQDQGRAEEARLAAHRDRERGIHAIGGLEAGMRAWQMRFAVFDPDRQREAFDACQDWTRLILAAARSARMLAAEQARTTTGAFDEMHYQLRYSGLWHTALAQVPNLLLVGGAGLGKTHLCLSVYHALIDNDVKVLYAPGMALLDSIRDRWDREEHEDTEERLMQRLITADVLVIDGPDMSARPWSRLRWFRILDGRSARGRPTLVTGKSVKQLETAIGEEGYDRLCDQGCVVTLHGTSYRRKRVMTTAALHRRAAHVTSSVGDPIALPPAE